MVHLETLQKQQEAKGERLRRVYEKVCEIRKNETGLQIYRRGAIDLKWLADFLLEADEVLLNCIFDGKELKRPRRVGESRSLNAGLSLGFDVGIDTNFSFNSYVMHLPEKHKEIFQCPECRLVYSMPRTANVPKLLEIKELPKPYRTL